MQTAYSYLWEALTQSTIFQTAPHFASGWSKGSRFKPIAQEHSITGMSRGVLWMLKHPARADSAKKEEEKKDKEKEGKKEIKPMIVKNI